MTIPTATEHPWLATDLANIADDVKGLRRHIYHLIADCFVSTTDHTVRTVRDLADRAPAALSNLMATSPDGGKNVAYGRIRLAAVFAAGVGLAILLGRARQAASK